jgi:hypothetical protein
MADQKPQNATVELKAPSEPGKTYYYDPTTLKIWYLWTSQGNHTWSYWKEVTGSKRDDLLTANASKVGSTSQNNSKVSLQSLGAGLPGVNTSPGKVTLKYPDNMLDVSDYVLFQFYDYKPPFGKGATKTNGTFDYNQSASYQTPSNGYQSIALYMPEDVSSGFRAQWTGKSMSTLAVDALRSMGQDGFEKVTNAAGSIYNFTERMGALAGATALQKATTKISGDALSFDDIFGSVSGSILNPNTELLFNAIDLRNFTLNFKLVPRNSTEAGNINNIIKQFQRATLPERAPGQVMGFNQSGTNNTGVNLGFIGMPKLVRVSFMHKTAENTKLPRFKMCAITNVDINYTPDGSFSTYHGTDGQPVAIGLSMGFQETKICFSEEIQNNTVR